MKPLVPDAQENRKLAREVALGAPIAGLVWLVLIKLFIGVWSFVFPLCVVVFSLALAAIMTGSGRPARIAVRIWKLLIHAIDWFVTRIVCALLYFLVFTPLGIVMRLSGSKYTQLSQPEDSGTCWRTPLPGNNSKQHFFRQF